MTERKEGSRDDKKKKTIGAPEGAQSIVENETGKTFWEEINKGRKTREGVDESIQQANEGGTSGNSWRRKEGKWWI